MSKKHKNMSVRNIQKPLRFAGREVMFGDVLYPPGGTWGPVNQRRYQLVILHFGEATVTLGNRTKKIPKGYLGLIRPGQKVYYQFSRKQKTRHTWCTILTSLLRKDLKKGLADIPEILPLSREMESLIEVGLSTQGKDKAARQLRRSLGETVFYLYLAESATARDGKKLIPETLRLAQRFIAEEYRESMGVTEISMAAGITRQHTTRLFRTHLKTTPMNYLWEIRLEKAVRLLTESGLTIAQIAYQTGFQSPFHFSRKVKGRYGRSPREMRLEKSEFILD